MMRKLIFTLAMVALLALTLQARSTEVIMTKQVLPHSTLPEKTDDWKFQNLKLDTTGRQAALLQALLPKIRQVMASDYEYFVFGLELQPGIDGVTATLQAFDPMSLTPANRKLLIAGVVPMGHNYLMIRTNPASEGLVSQITRKAGGKTKFVREFEMAIELIERHETTMVAKWQKGCLSLTRMVINGDDKLHPAPEPTATPDSTQSTATPPDSIPSTMTTDSIQ